jgi:hypothetical protein
MHLLLPKIIVRYMHRTLQNTTLPQCILQRIFSIRMLLTQGIERSLMLRISKNSSSDEVYSI